MNAEIIEMEDSNEEIQPMINQRIHITNSIDDFQTKLLDYVLQNVESEIRSTVKSYPEEAGLIKFKYKEHDNKTILIIACINEKVYSTTLDILCSAMTEKYSKIDYIDELWFGWEPLHYVAQTADFEKLKVILKYTSEKSINSLTYFSENALHVLLQYEKSVTPFVVVLRNGIESKLSTIISPEKDTIVQCAKLLIDKDVDVNHTNFWNETPICLAVRYRYTGVIDNLLTIDHIDLDSFAESSKTIREYLKWNLYKSYPKSYVQEDPATIGFNFLKSGDEERFLKFSSECISDTVNSFDGDNEDNSCGTMLQLCMRKGYLAFTQDDRSKAWLTTNDIKDNPMWNIFKSKGLARCILFLLDNGADPLMTSRKFPTSLLQYSALRGYYPFVAILLQHKHSKIQANHIFEVLAQIVKPKLICANGAFYRNCVLNLLLNRLVFLFRHRKEKLTLKRLNILNRLLRQLNLECVDKRPDDSEIICQILHLGGSLTAKKSHNYQLENNANCNKIIVERLDPNLLKHHFDDCIHGKRFLYDSIVTDDGNTYNENKTLHVLANDNQKRNLLCHPLLIELVRRKWSKVRWAFYIDLAFYALLLINIYIYIISLRVKYVNWTLNVLFYFLLFFHVIKEAFQLSILYRLNYFSDPSNVLEVITIISCLYTIINPNIYSSVAAILLSTFIFFVMLGQLPLFTKYTIIFSSIKYFFQYTGFYFIQFVSFALCFYLVSPFDDTDTPPDWGDVFKSLFYTLIYFTGEFSDRVLEPTQYPVFGRIIMTVFIICMTIILNNLLVGLIVADMDNIQQTNRLYKQVKLVSFIQSTNTFVKRLHAFKYLHCIKFIISHVDVFHKGQQKAFHDVDVNNFDEERKLYMQQIKKVKVFDRHLTRDIYQALK